MPIQRRTPRSVTKPELLRSSGWIALVLTAFAALGCGEPTTDPASTSAPESTAPPEAETTPDIDQAAALPFEIDRLSLLVVTLDTTRADRLAPYGARDVETPVLSRLASRGMVFEQAVAVTPVTLPSHASLFTGLYPPRHGIRNNGIHYLADSITTLAERLQGSGFRTAAVVSAAVLDARYGLDQGFDFYDDDLSDGAPKELRLNAERPARQTIDRARDWLDEGSEDERFFLWVHLFDPHAPYDPPEPYASRYAGRPYDGEIAALDAEIGRLLEHPRLDPEETVVMVVADHGESLGEHGEDTHAMLLYEGTQRIPWIVRHPGIPSERRLATPVSQVDLLPTVLELLGLDPADSVDGFSLAASILGEPPRSERETRETAIYLETLVPFYTYGWAELRALREGSWKLVEAPTRELYELESDPSESDNRATRETPRVETMAARVSDFDSQDTSSSALPRDREMEARLRSLGYLGGGAGSADRERLDPKDVIDLHLAVERGQELFFAGQADRAEAELRPVFSRDPDNLQALTTLAKIRVVQGRIDEAIPVARRAIELDPQNPDLHVALGQVEVSRGDYTEALVAFETALQLDPLWLDAGIERVRCLDQLGRRDEAIAALETILENDADHGRSQVAWAELVELPAGDLEQAEGRLRSVVEQEPRLVEGWRVLGKVQEAGRRYDQALATYLSGLGHRPGDGSLLARLGALQARLGRVDEARQSLEQALAAGQDTASVHYGLASLWIRGRDWSRVESHARRAIELDPGLSGAWNLLAASLEETSRFDEALVAYTQAIASDDTNFRARLNRGLLQMRLEHFEAARDDFEGVLELRGNHAGAHFQLGLLYAQPLADRDRARRHLTASLEAEPAHPRAAEIRRLLSLL